MSFFKVNHTSSKSKARLGTITTDHGVIHTPAFVPVGTKGTIKGLTQPQIKELGVQVSFVNTYHLVTHPGVEVLERAGGVHAFAKYTIPLMSDSGGFQVFSLAQREKKNSSSVIPVKTGIQEKSKEMRDWIHPIKGCRPSSAEMTISRRIGLLQASDTGFGTLATPFDMKEQPLVEKISEDGVMFRSVYDGALINFTPETSMDFQRIIGADINMAFDECTYYPATHEYTEKAMNRTHSWLTRCIKHRSVIRPGRIQTNNLNSNKEIIDWIPASAGMTKNTTNYYPLVTSHQYLYGIIQGGTYEDLRKKSAEFVVAQNTPGIAIGGVSVGESKEEMRHQVQWVSAYLPKDRPVHLLGVGQVDDIVDLVKEGIDTFDCVEPTRVARMGSVYQTKAVLAHLDGSGGAYELDINKSIYKRDLSALDENCSCSTCVNYSKAYLHHLFKQRELLGYTLVSFHNLYVMEKLMQTIRDHIKETLI